jgi:hypothetical protein
MKELEEEFEKHRFAKILVGITDQQLALMPDILKQCYRLVLIGCAFGTFDERFGMFFNGLQDLLKEFSDEAYDKAFSLGNDIFMQIARDKEKAKGRLIRKEE